MTICIAAIAGNLSIIGACDRMITSGSGDIQFEPNAPASPAPNKVIPFTRSIVAMFAGDVAIQTEVLTAVNLIVRERVRRDPTNWWLVAEVAQLYRACFAYAISRRAEAAVLLPIGLDINQLRSGGHDLTDEQTREIHRDLQGYWPANVQASAAILCGVDQTGPHIWRASDGAVWCDDAVGFSVIGIGDHHATSELMNARFSNQMRDVDVFYHVYAAKRRSQAAVPSGGPRRRLA